MFKFLNKKPPVKAPELVPHTPIPWRHLIPESPTETEFQESFKHVFGFYPIECVFVGVFKGVNTGFNIKTPTTFYSHGGFGEYTDNPVIKENGKSIFKDVWYNGGITWGIDDNGDRYYRIDKTTLLPADFEKVKAIEIIKSYYRINKTIKIT